MRVLTTVQTAMFATFVALLAVGDQGLASLHTPAHTTESTLGALDLPISGTQSNQRIFPTLKTKRNHPLTTMVTTTHVTPDSYDPSAYSKMKPTTLTTTTTTTVIVGKHPGSSPSTVSSPKSIAPIHTSDKPSLADHVLDRFEWCLVKTDEGGILDKFGTQKPAVKTPGNIFVISDLQGELAPFIDTIEYARLANVKPTAANPDEDCTNWRMDLRAYGLKSQDYLPAVIEAFLNANWKNAPLCIEWTGGKSVLVIIGNIFGSGPHSQSMVYFLMALREKARAAGGDVVIVLGDHDINVFTHHGAMPNSIALAQFAINETQWKRLFELEYKFKYPTRENPFSLKGESKSSSSLEDSKSKTKETRLLDSITDDEHIEYDSLRAVLMKQRRYLIRCGFLVNPLIAAQIGLYLFAHPGIISVDPTERGVRQLNEEVREKIGQLVKSTTPKASHDAIIAFLMQHIKHTSYSIKAISDDLIMNERKKISYRDGIEVQNVELSESQLKELSKATTAEFCLQVKDVLRVNNARRVFMGYAKTDSRMVETLCGGGVVYPNTGSGYFPKDAEQAIIRNQAIVRIKFDKPGKNEIRHSATIWVVEQEPEKVKSTDPTPGQLEEKGVPRFKKRKWRTPKQLPLLGMDRKVKSTIANARKTWEL